MISNQAILISLINNLTLTLLLELGASILLKCPERLILRCFILNAVTNPIVGIILDTVYITSGKMPPVFLILSVEIVVVLFEGYLYSRVTDRRYKGYLLSLILNIISYFGGLLL